MRKKLTFLTIVLVLLIVLFVVIPRSPDKFSEKITNNNINNNNVSTKGPEEVIISKEKIQDQVLGKTNLDQKIEPKKEQEVVVSKDSTQTKQDDVQLPDLPKGFSWQRLEAINGWVARPQNWYFTHEQSGSTNAYFVTKQEITNKHSIFDVGVSMNVIPSSGVPGGDAYKYGKYYIEKYQGLGSIEFSDEEEIGVLSVFRVLGTFQDSGVEFNMALEVLANRNTNTLYIIQFESPVDEWEKEWDNGSQILDLIMLDDEV